MEMPKPGAEHEKLKAMVGTFIADERLHPSPWDPDGGTAKGQLIARLGLDGFFVISDYSEDRGEGPSFRGHGVYGWDAEQQRYTMHWFDSTGGDPGAPVLGTWEGDRLTFERSEPERGWHRYAYVFNPEGYRFTISMSKDGKDWKPWMEADFKRV
jgi:hypothetical protein